MRLTSVLIAVSLGLGGCASMEASDKTSQTMGSMPVVGLPANTPERPTEVRAFPAVHDMPPQRTTAVLTAEEQRVMERELVSARENHKPAAKPDASKPAAKPAAKPPAAARARPAPPPAAEAASAPRRVPASSSQMIY